MNLQTRPKTTPFTPTLAVERVLVSRRLCLDEVPKNGRLVKIGVERIASNVWFVRSTIDREDKSTRKGPRWVTLKIDGARNVWQVHDRDPRVTR